jgi:hypothetical protein
MYIQHDTRLSHHVQHDTHTPKPKPSRSITCHRSGIDHRPSGAMPTRQIDAPPAASTGALGPAATPPLPLPPGYEDELVAGIELGRHQQHRRPSAKQPGNSAPPIPNSPLPLARVLRVEGEFLDVETGQQQRHAFAVVVMPPPPLTQRRGSSSSAWRRAGLAAWRFCGVVARVVLRVVVLVLVAVLLLLLFSIVASLVQWCRGPGREICP